MPLNRYQLRSEYSLADPELYKVADKDDPEALLEGVAMAGLVGVLRQLGDLAEFAAEIFHDLHEEVMATAGRGHGLIVRVQQLEAEFPSIERTLLSQTSHTAFLYNTGVDWHPNLHMNQSVVTRGDLPRFVMDSYEECRGPPRLFLLDKYDVAGAGACLKRFTDPSFFKMESTSTGRKLEGQREKKTRRVKKRGSRWRNGDTPESFPSSHAKLHQLFLEERIESGINDPARRVKLKKRQFTGSLFQQDNVRSYMERFLVTSPPEQKILHEVCIDPLKLTWTSDKAWEAGLETVDIGAISPVKESRQIDKTVCSSPGAGEMVIDPSMDDFDQDKLNVASDNESVKVPGFNNESNDGNVSTIPKEVNVDSACEFDDVASEIDNYVDALANIESEVETDSESKKNPRYLNWKPIVADSDGSERHREFRSVSLDSQSIGNSATSEDGDIFSKGRESSSCSNSVNTMTEAVPELDAAVVAAPTVLASNSDSDNMSFDHYSTSEEIHRKEREKHAAASTVRAEVDDYLQSEQGFDEALKTPSLADSNKKVLPMDVQASLKKNPSSDSSLENSAKHDAPLGEIDQGHIIQTTIISSHTTLSDASEDSGHCFGGEPIHDKESLNTSVCPDMRHSMPNISDGSAHLLETEFHTSACSSLVEGYAKDLERPDIDSCSDSGPPSHHQSVCEPTNLEKTNSIYLPCEENFSIQSTEENSKDLYSASDTSVGFGTQELPPVTMDPGCIHSINFEEGYLPWSREDPSVVKIVSVSEERVPSAPHVSQAGNSAISNQLQSCVPEFSSEFTEAAEIDERGFLEAGVPAVVSSKDESFCEISENADSKIVNDSFEVGKSSSTIEPLETQPEWLKLLSETLDSTVPAICQDEASMQRSLDDTCTVYPVSVGGNEGEAGLHVGLSEREPISQDLTWMYPDQGKVLEPDTLVPEAVTLHGEANTDHDPAGQDVDEDKIFCHDASSVDMPSKHAYDPDYVFIAENDLGLDHVVKKVKYEEVFPDNFGQVEVKDYPHENGSMSSSLLLHPEKNTEKFQQNDEELTEEQREELIESRQLDLVQDASVTSLANTSPDDSPPSSLLNDDLLPEDLENSGKLAAETPLPSEKSSEHLESTSSHEINLLEADNLDLLNHDILKPEDNEIEKSKVVAALHYDGQTAVSKTSAQSDEHILETSTLVSHGNGMLSGANQGTQVENSIEPLSGSGFRDLGKNSAAVPQINMEPPSLPPLPPMQWRLGKFQNSPVASAERQMVQPIPVPVQVPSMSLPTMHHHLAPVQPMNLSAVHHALASFQPVNLAAGNGAVTPIPLATQPTTLPAVHYAYAPLQPMTFPARDQGTENIAQIFSGEGYSDDCFTPGGIVALPVPIAVSEGFYQINTSAAGRQDNLPSTVPSTSKNLDGYATEQGIFVTPIPAVVSEGASQSDTRNVGRQESQDTVPTVVTSSPTNSLNGSQLCDESDQPNIDGPESRSFVEDHPAEHRSIMEEKLHVETGIQNELLGHNPLFPEEEEEAVNTYVQPLVSLGTDQMLPGLVAPEAGRAWSSAYDMFPMQEDGISNGTLQKKPPRPRNPLIDEVVAIDKSKLRKVDRTKTSLETRADERESFIEQMQLRKVERVKPSIESKEEGGEYRLEHSQLRKVGERAKPSAEQKAEEEFSLEQLQLRKVGERVKPLVEPKSEEREFLPEQLQLRKVGVKTKQETELKVEETGSPLQLRKVRDKVREEVELKAEETESPRVQLRKVKERFREEIELKAEETESPRVQLRKVGERTQPQVGQKVEERDSLFEQIRNKSFNLKPAIATRPNIQGPRTNLKVAAILEKASTIRQAMAGSDEDDDDADNWSDS